MIAFDNFMAWNFSKTESFSPFAILGSILVSFDIQGDLDATQEAIWSDIQSGNITLTFNGYTLTPDQYLQVGGVTYGELVRPSYINLF